MATEREDQTPLRLLVELLVVTLAIVLCGFVGVARGCGSGNRH
jgi:hypothetical protein